MPSQTRRVGSRAQVWHETAEKTSGGLTKSDLEKNKYGRIVSKKRSATMRKKHGGSEEPGF